MNVWWLFTVIMLHHVLRFWNEQLFNELKTVLTHIMMDAHRRIEALGGEK